MTPFVFLLLIVFCCLEKIFIEFLGPSAPLIVPLSFSFFSYQSLLNVCVRAFLCLYFFRLFFFALTIYPSHLNPFHLIAPFLNLPADPDRFSREATARHPPPQPLKLSAASFPWRKNPKLLGRQTLPLLALTRLLLPPHATPKRFSLNLPFPTPIFCSYF